MPYAVRYREELPEPVQRELDDMIAYFNHQLEVIQAPDGTLLPAALVPPAGTDITDESHWWRKGPWSFDDPDAADPNIAAILTPDIAGPVSVNDFAPKGIDTCIILQLSPITGALTLNGIKSPDPRRRRIMLLYNVSTTQNVILANANSGSQPTNRFNLPNGDVTLAPGQTMWLYWSIAGWNAGITAQQSGGLFGEGSTSFPSTVITVPVTLSNVVFRTRTVINNASILTLNSVPVTVVSAPGSGKFLHLVSAFTLRDNVAGVYSANTNWSISWAGLSDVITTAYSSNGTSAQRRWQQLAVPGIGNTTDIRNLALTFRAAADVTGGNAANYLVVDCEYTIVTDGP